MKFVYGFMGRILRINLSSRKIHVEPLKEGLVKKIIGGRGLGAKILWDELPSKTDPLSPQNKLVFTVGPLTGTKAQSASRWIVQFKSPLTETYFRSVGGGFFGAELKFAGYDAIIVEGKAEKPVYIWIYDDAVEFKEASHIWGLDTDFTREILLEETDRNARIVMIGPAGERLVKFAAIVTDDMRTASRGGGGAVMGSKNLKAIVIKGSKRPEIFNEKIFDEAVKEQIEMYKKNPMLEAFRSLGTAGVTYTFYTLGHFPTYNFKQLELENIDRFKPQILETYVVRYGGCYGCMMRCWQYMKTTKGLYAGILWDKPEYETLWSLGGVLGITNIEAIIYANMLCDRYGLDTISTGVTLAFVYELYEKGILSKRELDGLEPRWGDSETVIELIRKIALREGIGNLLAEGTRRAAEIIGRGAEKYAMHVKGLEMPAYDPRSAKAHGLSIATSPIGASHTIGWNRFEILGIPKKVDPFTTEGKGELTKYLQDETAVLETAIFCIFPRDAEMVTVDLYSKLLYAATGIEEFKDPRYLLLIGERIFNLERAFNVREEIDGQYDIVPERILKEPVPRNPSKGQVFESEVLIKDYYRARKWNERGIPTKEKLEELELHDVAKELERFY